MAESLKDLAIGLLGRRRTSSASTEGKLYSHLHRSKRDDCSEQNANNLITGKRSATSSRGQDSDFDSFHSHQSSLSSPTESCFSPDIPSIGSTASSRPSTERRSFETTSTHGKLNPGGADDEQRDSKAARRQRRLSNYPSVLRLICSFRVPRHLRIRADYPTTCARRANNIKSSFEDLEEHAQRLGPRSLGPRQSCTAVGICLAP